MEIINELELIRQYLAGDGKSLEILIKRYLKPVYSFVYRYLGNAKDAEDITQEAFVRIWRNLKKFDQTKSFKTWMFSIAKNASIDFLRKKKTVPFSEFDNENGDNALLNTLEDCAPLPDEIFDRANLAESVKSAIQKLSVSQRALLFLRYNDHFNFREIAESLGESINTVKSRHRRALVALKELLQKTINLDK